MSRYYWLKMRRDFFKRHDIRILEGLPNGKELVLFYVKLLVESVDHEGALRYSKTRAYTPEMLAAITDTTPEFTAQALETLSQLELITDSDDGTICLPYAIKLIDSATDSDNAQKQRRYRERKRAQGNETLPNEVTPVTNALPQKVTRVTEPLPQKVTQGNTEVTRGNKSVTKSYESIEYRDKSIELDIDKEKDKEKDASATKRFVAPTHDEILDYMTSYSFEKGLSVDPVVEAEKFFNYYTSNGWRVGRNKMKDYKATARNWLLNAKEFVKADPATNPFTDILGGEF